MSCCARAIVGPVSNKRIEHQARRKERIGDLPEIGGGGRQVVFEIVPERLPQMVADPIVRRPDGVLVEECQARISIACEDQRRGVAEGDGASSGLSRYDLSLTIFARATLPFASKTALSAYCANALSGLLSTACAAIA